MPFSRRILIQAVRAAFHHRCNAARLYRALAVRERDKERQVLLLFLAVNEYQRALLFGKQLRVLGASVPADVDSWTKRVWRSLLVQSGRRLALAWIKGDESIEAFGLAMLARLQCGPV